VSATVTIPAGITVILDDGRHDLMPGTYPVHATTMWGQQVPVGDRPHFLEVDLPTAATSGIGVVLVRIPAYEDLFPVQTVGGLVRFAINSGASAASGVG
jgi:hypothetical protein